MTFSLLGPLVVRASGVTVPIAPGKQRALLAGLLLNAGQVVPVGEIAETLWGPAGPPSARVTIQNYVMRLRHSLGEAGRARILTQPGGYLIVADAGELDVRRFEALLGAARVAARAGSWQMAAGQARTALALWRGEPLADVESELLALREVPRLTEMRLQATETRIDADLHLGRHAEVIAELRQLVVVNPLRERLHALLMLALYRAGSQAEALAAYQHARRVLVDELGTEPGIELRELHQQILTADRDLAVAAPGPMRVGGRGPVPRQLPGAVPHFAGRAAELAVLDGLLGKAGQQTPGTVVISAIGGTAGVGKTALAVHWAHRAAGRFPDGQLYVNLRGYDPSGAPVPPADAIRRFLDALGVPADRIPPNPEAREDLYRSLLAGQGVLVVLDNARDAAQVRPLLPGGPGCLVVVTSRSQLAGLVAVEGAHPLVLDVLSKADARELLAQRLGRGRIAAEPGMVTELIGLCARLPLALAITAARAALHPGLPLATLVTELQDASGRLDALDAGEAAGSVRAVFSWSYQSLSGPAARMFRLLGVHPGPDISAPAAASLTGAPPPRARRLLDELTGMHLLTEHLPGRFAFHDLLRAYAAEQAGALDSAAGRRRAVRRMLDHYLHTAHTAALLLNPGREPLSLSPPAPGVAREVLTGHEQALAWFQAEHAVLTSAIAEAAGAGFDDRAWQLSWTLTDYFDRRGDWLRWAATEQLALAAARRLGDRDGQARTSRSLAIVFGRLGRYRDATGHARDALTLFGKLGDLTGQARTHGILGWLLECQDRHRQALGHAEQALGLFRKLGHRQGEANVLNAIGWCRAQLGEYRQAVTCCHQAIAIYRELGNRYGEGGAWDSLGYAHTQLGHHREAVTCYRRAISLDGETGDIRGQAEVLSHLGDAYRAAGDPRSACDAWQRALSIFNDLHHPGASGVRAKLEDPDLTSIR